MTFTALFLIVINGEIVTIAIESDDSLIKVASIEVFLMSVILLLTALLVDLIKSPIYYPILHH